MAHAVPVYRNHLMHRHHGLYPLKMGYAYEALGDHPAAIRHLRESQAIFDQLQLSFYAERARDALDACQNTQCAASDRQSDAWPEDL